MKSITKSITSMKTMKPNAITLAKPMHYAKSVVVVMLWVAAGMIAPSLHSQTHENPTMFKMSTTLGEIEIELYPEAAPASVRNFVEYIESGHFDGLIFHRVIPGFMIQGGGFTEDMQPRQTRAPIKNEADNGLKNLAGTLAMARTSNPDSATSQFFINLVDNGFLDHTAKTPQGWGYAVLGKVVGGMAVVEKIAALPTGNVGPHGNVPTEPVVITRAEMLAQ